MRHISRRLWLAGAVIGSAVWAHATQAPAPAASPTPPPPVFLKAGEKVLPFDAEGIDGAMRHVDFPKKQTTILVLFSSGCPHCHKMIPEWNKWFGMRSSKMAMIGILIDREPPGFFERIPIAFPVLRAPGRTFLDDYKVARVPITLRVAPGGVVEDIGVGELDGIRLGQLFRE
jgi:hypothetical protein